MDPSNPPQPSALRHIFLYDVLRQRSHLVFKFISTHPDIMPLWHPYLEAHLMGPERIMQYIQKYKRQDGTIGEWREHNHPSTYAISTAKLLQARHEAQQENKILVSNEHCQFLVRQEISLAHLRGNPLPLPLGDNPNPTVIPDDVFSTAVPVFIIRHPIFSMESTYVGLKAAQTPYVVGDICWRHMTDVAMQRLVFDTVTKRDDKPPIVIDGDDVVWRTSEVGDLLCKRLGISSSLRESWDVTPQHERPKDPVVAAFLKNIHDSSGIVRSHDKPPDTCLDVRYADWCDRFGKDDADGLKESVDRNLPHYQYMKQFAI